MTETRLERLSDAALGLLNAIRYTVRRDRDLQPITAKLGAALAVAFESQGRALVQGLDRIRSQFREADSGPNIEPALTDAELSSIRLFADPIDEAARAGLVAGGERVYRNMKVEGRFGLENARAVLFLAQYGAKRVTMINDETRNQIRSIVTKGVAGGDSYNTIAAQITEQFKQFAVGKPQLHIASRAHLVAVTETANAYCEGNMIAGRELQDAGLEMVKSWSTTGDNRVSQGCQDNAAAGWIEFDSMFPSGHGRPPRFPGCRCDVLIQEEDVSKPAEPIKPGPLGRLSPLRTTEAQLEKALEKVNDCVDRYYQRNKEKPEIKRTQDILDRMTAEEHAALQKLADTLKDHIFGVETLSPEARARAVVDVLVDTWSRSSADNLLPVFLQRVAAKEFGLTAAKMEHIDPSLLAEGELRWGAHSPILQRFLRIQYDLTQELFAAHGITEVPLFRGVALDKNTVPGGAEGRPGPVVVVEAALQPLSSFSTDLRMARGFAHNVSRKSLREDVVGFVVGVRVPVSSILSSGRTGLGDLTEGEMVVLGVPGRVGIVRPGYRETGADILKKFESTPIERPLAVAKPAAPKPVAVKPVEVKPTPVVPPTTIQELGARIQGVVNGKFGEYSPKSVTYHETNESWLTMARGACVNADAFAGFSGNIHIAPHMTSRMQALVNKTEIPDWWATFGSRSQVDAKAYTLLVELHERIHLVGRGLDSMMDYMTPAGRVLEEGLTEYLARKLHYEAIEATGVSPLLTYKGEKMPPPDVLSIGGYQRYPAYPKEVAIIANLAELLPIEARMDALIAIKKRAGGSTHAEAWFDQLVPELAGPALEAFAKFPQKHWLALEQAKIDLVGAIAGYTSWGIVGPPRPVIGALDGARETLARIQKSMKAGE